SKVEGNLLAVHLLDRVLNRFRARISRRLRAHEESSDGFALIRVGKLNLRYIQRNFHGPGSGEAELHHVSHHADNLNRVIKCGEVDGLAYRVFIRKIPFLEILVDYANVRRMPAVLLGKKSPIQ